MSEASNNKVKPMKVNGWEEAGCEFYQENYCADWESISKTPLAINTLLPSKQNRLGTNKRGKLSQQHPTNRKSWQQFPSTAPRSYQNNDGQFSGLPDLSQIVNDEEHIWEEIFQVKQMPLTMQQKKELKSDLQNATKLRLQGFNQLKWKHRKAWHKIALESSKILAYLKLWQSSLKQIEGHFGSGVVAYFLFLRWLFYLNCITFCLIAMFVILPNLIISHDSGPSCELPVSVNSSKCSQTIDKKKSSFDIIEEIQGAGVLKSSILFYGAYSNQVIGINFRRKGNSTEVSPEYELVYDLTLAYVFVVLGYLVITLIAIVKAAAREFKDRLVSGRWQFYQYCNLVFGGWDFCIHNAKSSIVKHKAVYNEFKCSLQSKHIELKRRNRSKDDMCMLILIRTVVNFIIFVILAFSVYFIYILFNVSLKQEVFVNKTTFSQSALNTTDTMDDSTVDNLTTNRPDSSYIRNSMKLLLIFIDFAPFIGIVCLNLTLPTLFKYLSNFEKYSPLFVIKISLVRMIFLRLASLFILLSRFYYIVIPYSNLDTNSTYKCWETFVGIQFFKMIVTDFVSHLFVTFCVNFPRAFVARYFNNNFVKVIGEQEFELSKHVLDVMYSQTICWLGSFYMPFLPLLLAVMMLCTFYIKKFQCLVNSKPTKVLYGTSRSNSLFMLVLLISFFTAVTCLTYAFAEIAPSVTCGPFRAFNSVWDAPVYTFTNMPTFIKNVVYFFGTAAFAIPCFVFLTLLLYYFYAVSDANRNMVEVLKSQLVLEGHDKKFLLTRLSVFLKPREDAQE